MIPELRLYLLGKIKLSGKKKLWGDPIEFFEMMKGFDSIDTGKRFYLEFKFQDIHQ